MPRTRECPQEEMAAYKAAARRWRQQEQEELEQPRERAWQVAHRAAAFLKATHSVDRVVVFGSLARGGRIHRRTDIDLAVWGLDSRIYQGTR